MNYLLDTNACLDFLLNRNAAVVAKVDRWFGALSISTITVAELRVGSRASQDVAADERILDDFIARLQVEPFDAAAASVYGDIARRIGVRRGSFDRLIAAQAIAGHRTLVTNSTRDFADIPGLIVENWAQ